MAGLFKETVLTRKGIALLAKAQAEQAAIKITRAVSGNGIYEESEEEGLSLMTALKSEQQSFAPTTVARQNETNVFVRFTITNNHPENGPLLHGYYVTELGLYAEDPDEGEILYAIAIGEQDTCDFLPAYNNLLPATITVNFLIEVANAENVTITTDLSAYASRQDLNSKADGIGYDSETDEILLKANNIVISRVKLNLPAQLKITYASDETINAIINGTFTGEDEDIGTEEDSGTVEEATDEEIGSIIDGLYE